MTTTKRTHERIAAEVSVQRAEVVKLEAELASLPEGLQNAYRQNKIALASDPKKLRKLQDRYDALPMHINAAKVRHAQLRIEQLEAELAVAPAAIEPLGLEVERAAALAQEAQRELLELRAKWSAALEHERTTKLNLAEARQELERLVQAALPKPAPVVRSAWRSF